MVVKLKKRCFLLHISRSSSRGDGDDDEDEYAKRKRDENTTDMSHARLSAVEHLEVPEKCFAPH